MMNENEMVNDDANINIEVSEPQEKEAPKE